MNKRLFATALIGGLVLGSMAFAQSPIDMNLPGVGKEAGTFMIRARGRSV